MLVRRQLNVLAMGDEEARSTATYGIEIGVFLARRSSGSGELTFCSPW